MTHKVAHLSKLVESLTISESSILDFILVESMVISIEGGLVRTILPASQLTISDLSLA